jgi:hypothetical protein
MRLLLASVAALAAVAFAAPSFAQEDPAAAPTPTPVTKPKPGTAAYCSTLKTSTSKNTCLKRVHAQATPKKAPTSAIASKSKPKKLSPPADTSAQLTPPAAPAAASPAPSSSAPTQSVAIPPLPQKTI